MTESVESTPNNPEVHIEYCGVCDYGGHCLSLAKTISETTPNAQVTCKRGRQGIESGYRELALEKGGKLKKYNCGNIKGSFEIAVNDTLIYSKLKTMALPDYAEVSQVVHDVSEGAEPRPIKGEQPIDCVIS